MVPVRLLVRLSVWHPMKIDLLILTLHLYVLIEQVLDKVVD
jgi:hypothetical protein